MRRLALSTLVILVLVLAIQGQPEPPTVAVTPFQTPDQELKQFHLPPGFVAELVAAEPQIQKPMNIAFDARGRLWVTDTVEYPYPAPEGKVGRDTVKILEDTDRDGTFDKVTTFAEGLNIPIGILPYGDGAFVYSIPNLYRMRDTDGDGKADRREVVLGPFGYVDTHGMVSSLNLGFDGWIYLCHGFRNDSVVKGSDGQELRMNSGNTFRMKPDGSHVEAFTRGQVNPFGMCFDPMGNIYTADCHSRPLTQLLRGALYESFAKPHDGLGFAPHINNFDGHSTGLCGVTYYAADHFPKDYRGRLFLGDVVHTRINSYRLERDGSTVRAIRESFLTSDDRWFRPVDIKLGPDGALYVADFYNRIIGHYEVPLTHPGRDRTSGRIWRIVYKGRDGKAPPPKRPIADIAKASNDDLIAALNSRSLTVMMQAMHELAGRGEAPFPALRDIIKRDVQPIKAALAMWVLERNGALDDAQLAQAAASPHQLLRIHAMRVLTDRPALTEAQHAQLMERLKDADAMVRRCAVEALGAHPASTNITPLLNVRQTIPDADVQLVYATRLALRNQLRLPEAWRSLADLDGNQRHHIADVATGVPSKESAAFLLDVICKGETDHGRLSRFVHHLARYGSGEKAAEFVKFARSSASDDLGRQVVMLQAFQRGSQERGSALAGDSLAWAETTVKRMLESRDAGQNQMGADLAGSLRLMGMQDAVRAVASDIKKPDGARGSAAAALVTLGAERHVDLLGKLVREPDTSYALRERVARAMGGVNQPKLRAELLEALANAPAPTALMLAQALVSTPAGCEALMDAIATGKASARLLLERPIDIRLREARLRDFDARRAKLTAGLPPADTRINDLIRRRRDEFLKAKPDLAMGAKLFTEHCAACHQIGGQGAKIGPQLDGIGVRGLDRLLEDTLDPNRNLDPAFRTTRLALKNGREVSGLLLRDAGAVVVIADLQGKEVQVPIADIEERSISPLSPMPANWGERIPPEQFSNVMAYLLSQRSK